jgi:hypothetical protein
MPASFKSAHWIARLACGAMAILGIIVADNAQALPAFARQTGQNCVSCHAGGQFPELTPYGRMFKMTGYTIGERTIPISVMGVATSARVDNTSKSDDPTADFQKNGTLVPATASVFLAGKVTDNIGIFSQTTYDNYAGQKTNADGSPGSWYGHSNIDNFDLRFADRFIDARRDLIVGLSANNNPSISDPWNSAAAWMQYVPGASLTSHDFTDANSPYTGYGAGGNIAGVTAYLYWNKTIYAELGTYRTANKGFSLLSAGIPDTDTTKLRGSNNPYWRLAATHEWGAHNIMVGASGMRADVYDVGTDISDPNNLGRFDNTGVDAQYQYILDPHTVTVQAAYMRQKTTYSNAVFTGGAPGFVLADGVTPIAAANPSDTTNVFRAKLSYIFQAKYGGSLSYFNLTGSTNTLNQSSGYEVGVCAVGAAICSEAAGGASSRVGGNLSGNPATRGLTYEAFWTPVQYVRVGVQYTAYDKFNGASTNYDGLGRDAKDNNTLFFYIWGAY